MALARYDLGVLAVCQAQHQELLKDHFMSFSLAACEVGAMTPKGPRP